MLKYKRNRRRKFLLLEVIRKINVYRLAIDNSVSSHLLGS